MIKEFFHDYKCNCGCWHREKVQLVELEDNEISESAMICFNGKKYPVIVSDYFGGTYLCMPFDNVACPFDIRNKDAIRGYLTKSLNDRDIDLIIAGLNKWYDGSDA